ncbi:hypothetical protein ACRRQX_001106 [Yersinia enterocolitica]|nr:hypothetical protein [Yersinia enterocolitica]
MVAYFDTEDNTVGVNVWCDYPLSYDEVAMPFSGNENNPSLEKILSSMHYDRILTAAFAFRKKRKYAWSGTGLLPKQHKKIVS